ncbi:MAG: DUF1993 domain-containing protein [Cyanobacteria bacterium P01_A01_bin.17]
MTISMYKASIPPMVRALNNLIGILEKGAAHAESKGIDASVLVNTRLFPDMFPLAKQVQIASDVARRGAARLAGAEAPAMEDNEATFPELIARSRKTIEYLETFTPEQIDGSEEHIIALPLGGDNVYKFPGLPYLLSFVMPNVYFHVTTAYDILRHCGVEIGKIDYLGQPD